LNIHGCKKTNSRSLNKSKSFARLNVLLSKTFQYNERKGQKLDDVKKKKIMQEDENVMVDQKQVWRMRNKSGKDGGRGIF